jgi:hypothetical protein
MSKRENINEDQKINITFIFFIGIGSCLLVYVYNLFVLYFFMKTTRQYLYTFLHFKCRLFNLNILQVR